MQYPGQSQQPQQYGTYRPYDQESPQVPGGSGGYGQPQPQYSKSPNLPGQPYPPGPNDSGKSPVGVGEMPADDAEGSPEPSAPPPMQNMDNIQGYQDLVNPNVSFVPPPPSYDDATREPDASPEQFRQGSQITEAEARECLVRYAQSKCCWGKSAAESMTIDSVQSSTAVHYILRTYQESRSTDWASEPYNGQYVDGPENGMPPQPWDIQIPSPQSFTDQVVSAEVPHTASVKVCHTCQGSTMVTCYSCHGWGAKRCTSCSGSGHTGMHDNRRHCTWCHGSGRRQCYHCHGMGRVHCSTCAATGRVKYFIRMTVTFKTHTVDFILERTALPDHLIRDVTGLTLFEDTQPLLYPIRSFPEPQVNQQSAALVQQHSQLAQSGRILMQNHVVRGVPVFQCDSTHKGKSVQFFVYGNDRQVHAPDYPQKCCWGCQLL